MSVYHHKYRPYLKNKDFLFSLALAVVFLFVSLVLNFYAGTYATKAASNYVTDIVLSNIPVVDMDGVFVYGFVVFFVFVAFLCFIDPKAAPFIIKSIALFILIRSIFICLTHIAPFPTEDIITSRIASKFTFGADLFFSAHAGLPFLMALIFWKDFRLRALFIIWTVFFSAVVLLAHLHYTIDVLSAIFITYTICHIAEIIFKKDYKMLLSGID